MTAGSSTVLSSSPARAVAAAVQGGEEGALTIGLVVTVGLPVAALPANKHVSILGRILGLGVPSPQATSVDGPQSPESSWAPPASEAPPPPTLSRGVSPVVNVLDSRNSSQTKCKLRERK
jgi:hypothetical protein